MYNSKHVEDAQRLILRLVAIKSPPSRKEFCHVRDYILTYIILENASMSGCISNIRLAEFSRREYQNDNSCIIAVMDLKTKATAGPAMLSINSQLSRDITKYLRIRSMLPGIPILRKTRCLLVGQDVVWHNQW